MNNQREKLTKQLMKIAIDVTAQDRTACADHLGISKTLLCYYLNGRVTNNDRAIKALEFFKKRIKKRNKEINSLCQQN